MTGQHFHFKGRGKTALEATDILVALQPLGGSQNSCTRLVPTGSSYSSDPNQDLH